MKDNISIIFASIIGVLLIVILPLFSILDRQDSMSYNVVLTQTTKFVDNIRNNGFIDKESYNNYILALASTSNTYKVEMEIYRKRLIPDTSAAQDTYVEDVELFNTMDILEAIESENSVSGAEGSNVKNSVYLLKENDEIYFKVYNTNITAGSIIYNAFARTTTNKVINISYGGVVNNINWELFNKINATAVNVPEVLMEVPVNANGQTNITKVTGDNQLEQIDCDVYPELCEDSNYLYQTGQYTYLYDLTYTENTQMTIAVELKNMDYIVVGENADGSLKLTNLEDLTKQEFNKNKDYIIDNFIQLNEMFADVDLQYRGKEDYMFNIVLKNIKIASIDLLSVLASVSILPGLGQDSEGVISMGAESVKVELVDETSVHKVTITNPINWGELLKTGNVSDSLISGSEVYVNQEIAFVISYTGIDSNLDIKSAVQSNLSIQAALYSGLEILTAAEVKDRYNIDLNTRTIGHIIVKLKYIAENLDKEANYIKINSGWIQTNVDDGTDYKDEEYIEKPTLAYGAESSRYAILLDNGAPIEPIILVDGIKGNDDWYIRNNVILSIQESTTDTIIKLDGQKIGGSGVARNTLTLTGATELPETEISQYIIDKEGTTYAVAKAYDYVGNVVSTDVLEIKLDKTAPKIQQVTLDGTKGNNNWYISNVSVKIEPGTDSLSGLQKTTYRISGAHYTRETNIPQNGSIVLSANGKNTITITSYDKAGNYSSTVLSVYIDKTTPAGVDFDIISGSKNANGWYNTDVTLYIAVNDSALVSGIAKTQYQLIGTDGGENIGMTEYFGGERTLKVSKSGNYTLKTYTYNLAGNFIVQEFTFSIDKDVPNVPSIIEYSATSINNGWYKDIVNVTLISNKDVGPSTEQIFSYTVNKNGNISERIQTTSPKEFSLTDDGIYIFDVYSLDYASNESHSGLEIKIDRTLPISAEFIIKGIKGLNDWYISDVSLAYTGGSDETSGLKNVTLSKEEIITDTTVDGTQVTMTTEDNAGNTVTKTTVIKVDKTAPTEPTINIPEVTGHGITGVNLYNMPIAIAIAGGTDINMEKTTYKIVDTQTDEEIKVESTVNSEINLRSNGKYEVTAYSYDKAGNRSQASKVIWINVDKPGNPKLSSINGQSITNTAIQTITGSSNTLNMEFTNVEIGSKLSVVLIKEGTYERQQAEVQVKDLNQVVSIHLPSKGTYSITATQTNMYGTESDLSTGSYNYKYE